MILKLLIIVGIIAFVYFKFFHKPALKTPKGAKKKKTALDDEEMVQCEHCSVYVALEETLISNGKYYCSQECLDQHKS